ncbi:MAG: hypothetical protein WAU11_10600 [Ignavibacteriaceae bacterium]
MAYIKLFLILITIVVLSSCSSLTLTPAEFGWPIEAVLKIDKNGFVKEERSAISFDTKALFIEETQDSLGYAGKTLRIIRNHEGFYFMTSVDFKNVYVFGVEKNSFTLENKIELGETGLTNPAFNQRKPFIELIDDGKNYKLTSEGIEEGVK